MALNLSDEYTVSFDPVQPLGMKWSSRKSDNKRNLYVTKIEKNSVAYQSNVILASKIIRFNKQNVEDIGAKEVMWRYTEEKDESVAKGVELKITFRKPKQSKSEQGRMRPVSIYQNYSPNSSENVPAIKFPVDCGKNAMELSTPNRLQENFIVILQYMATATNTEDEWITFLSNNDFEVLTRFAKTTKRLLECENEQKNDDNKEFDEEDHENKSSAFGWLCTILNFFGNLDKNNFIGIVTEYAFNNIVSSLKNHAKMTRLDCMNRLNALQWIFLGNAKLTDYMQRSMDDSNSFLSNMCDILNHNAFNNVIKVASKCLIFGITRTHKTHIKESLHVLQDTLSGDAFRHFTELYFEIFNNSDFSDDNNEALELLIEFNAFIFRYDFHSFYFTSDIKVCIDIYLRNFHNASSSKPLLLCLDGCEHIIRWKGYANKEKLNKYKLNDLIDTLQNDLTKTLKENENEFVKMMNEFDDKQKDQKYTKLQLSDTLRLIQLIQMKINIITATLNDIQDDKYDYGKVSIIELPIDSTQLKTRSMRQLQNDLLALRFFLSQNINTTEEWLHFLSENNYEFYTKLCELVVRCLKNERRYISSADDKKEHEIDVDIDTDLLFPLTLCCQLLALFASLDPPPFVKTMKLRVLNPLRAALRHSDKLKSEDIMIRLQVLLFVINHGVLLSNEWFLVLCNLLSKRADDDNDDVLMISTQCIAYFIGTMKNKEKQKEFLLHLQTKLKNENDFGHFTEAYISLINQIKITEWDDPTTKLLIDFVICVMQQQFKNFFYLSSMRILVEIYLRCVRNIDIGCAGFQVCLNGISSLFEWKHYKNGLHKYLHSDIVGELNEKLQIATDYKMDNIAKIINGLLTTKI